MNNIFIIDNLLHQEKSSRLEFVKDANAEYIAATATAMLNLHGGDILVGVDSQKRVTGLSNQDVETVVNILEQIKPAAPVYTNKVDVQGKSVLLISTWEGFNKPYQYKGIVYTRVGESTQPATVETMDALLKERKKSDYNWERSAVLGAELEDLDMDEVRKTIESYNKRANESVSDEEEFLMKMGLLRNGNLTNACIVLFAKNPLQYIVQARIRLSVFASDNRTDLVQAQLFEGNLFKNVTGIFQFFDMAYSKSISIDGLYRSEKWNYPRVAMREGILNAVVHRDYNSLQGFMDISIYPNQVSISNYGTLPEMIKIEDLSQNHPSVLRNPDIAQICFYRNLIEMMGTGTQRMVRDCQEHGFELPKWQTNGNTITVSFLGLESSIRGNTKGGTKSGTKSGTKNSTKNMITIMETIKNIPDATLETLQIATGLSKSGVRKIVDKLRTQGKVRRVGPLNGGHWEVVE